MTIIPTNNPTVTPFFIPSFNPTNNPSTNPTLIPSLFPSSEPITSSPSTSQVSINGTITIETDISTTNITEIYLENIIKDTLIETSDVQLDLTLLTIDLLTNIETITTGTNTIFFFLFNCIFFKEGN